MRHNLPERVIRDITALARKHGIGKIILFGSRARGTHTERSDIDIAVYGGDFDSFYWDIQERVHTLLTFYIIDGNKITAELKNEIERDGVVLYEKAG